MLWLKVSIGKRQAEDMGWGAGVSKDHRVLLHFKNTLNSLEEEPGYQAALDLPSEPKFHENKEFCFCWFIAESTAPKTMIRQLSAEYAFVK